MSVEAEDAVQSTDNTSAFLLDLEEAKLKYQSFESHTVRKFTQHNNILQKMLLFVLKNKKRGPYFHDNALFEGSATVPRSCSFPF